jgi:3-deoxy-manno-octulosonate cytidylyltransferase (CMP-KDO synthetase)
MGARRLPGKPLADLGGRPVIEWVRAAALAAECIERVVVATEDQAVLDAVQACGGEAVLTAPCACGTDRVLDACDRLGLEGDLILNIQGDMPGINPSHIDAVVRELASGGCGFVTAASPISSDLLAESRDVVKVVLDKNGRALFFSRAPIPSRGPWLQHLGLYGFTREVLREYAGHEAGVLTRSEDLEQLRWLEIGEQIQVVLVEQVHPSIDTPAQLATMRSLLKSGKLKYPVLSE